MDETQTALISRVEKYVRAKTDWHVSGESWRDGKLSFLIDGERIEAVSALKEFPSAWKHVRKIVVNRIESNKPLDGEYRNLALSVLREDMPKKKKGRQSLALDETNHSRDHRICVGILALEKAGIKPTTYNESDDPDTGCSIVANALFLDPDTIKTIWAARDRHLKNGVGMGVMIDYLINPKAFPHMGD